MFDASPTDRLNALLPELQLMIFSMLDATELASLAGTCANLHNSPGLISALIEKLEGKVVKSVSAKHNTFFLMHDGRVSWCGLDFGLQPGGHHQLTPEPITIPGGGKVQTAAVGIAHTIVSMQDGSVYGLGKNNKGQLGLGHTARQLTPVRLNIGNPKIFEAITLLKQRQQPTNMPSSAAAISAPPMPKKPS